MDLAYRFYQTQKGRGLLNIRSLKHAVKIYQGEFLDRFSCGKGYLFEEWSSLMREKYNLQAIKALAYLSNYYEQREEYHLAIETTRRIIEIAPWDEAARSQMMRIYGITGQWNAAQSQFMVMQTYLKEEFNTKPSPELAKLNHQIQQTAAGKTTIQPLFSQNPFHVPKSTTIFIGRFNDIDH